MPWASARPSPQPISEGDVIVRKQRLQGLIPSIIRKGDFNRERFLELLLKRGERRSRGTPPLAA